MTYPAAVPYRRLLDHANRHNPYPYFAELAAEPIQRLDDHTWVVTGHAEISLLLRDPRLSVAGPRELVHSV